MRQSNPSVGVYFHVFDMYLLFSFSEQIFMCHSHFRRVVLRYRFQSMLYSHLMEQFIHV